MVAGRLVVRPALRDSGGMFHALTADGLVED